VSDFKANEYEQIDRDRRQFSYSRVASLLGAVVFVFAGMSFGADSPLEKWRSEGERHAVDEAIVTFGHASPPRGRILLVRDAGAMCAIRFNNFSRAHDAKPGDMFNSGDESFSAEYDWYALDAKTAEAIGSGKATVKRGRILGIGRMVLPSNSAALQCGSIRGLGWNYPMYVSMYTGNKPSTSSAELAPTGWADIKHVNLHDPKLRWYAYDEERHALVIPFRDLPM